MGVSIFLLILFSITAVICLSFSIKHRWLLWPLVLAYVFRTFLFFLDTFRIFRPPGADTDAVRFTVTAHHWSQWSWQELFEGLNLFESLFYSWLGAVVQKLVGQSVHILPAFSFVFGHVVVAMTGLIAYQLWGKRAGIFAAFIMALYPFAAFNSILAMREEVAIMFFVLGLYYFLRWVGGKSLLGLLWACTFFGIAVMFHPGWIGAFIGMAAYLIAFLFRTVIKSDTTTASRHDAFKVVLASAMLLLSIGMVASGGNVYLGKGIEIGGEGESGVGDAIESRFMREATGGSAYPSFIATGNPYTQPWLIPGRIVYFLFSPFPWDIRSARQLLGVISSLLYMFLAWRVYKGWDTLKHREECIAMLFMFGALTFIFAIGVTNIGTAIRHKTKLLALFVILAASTFRTISIKLRRA
ncbi:MULTISPECIES: glycosyltransferase family 39 protein [Halomonadaceae]|uniref:ArnT family glycosyltransferase n=1 Tax=Halomonadaceae TaxID=28256 RepID=UPI00159776E4|nr:MULTISPECIES: glycosyltransferase family 39 protein [Halomonas]QJQ94011.1 hypothetical protein HIO72_00985 [Halomonas sp. PA5]